MRFNPFFIRASVYWERLSAGHKGFTIEFQSLLHQGISLLSPEKPYGNHGSYGVSIPSSSGHQFTGVYEVVEREDGTFEFQSLLHQGISLLLAIGSDFRKGSRPSFNPFFIRASVY